jgi:hypothetical protein
MYSVTKTSSAHAYLPSLLSFILVPIGLHTLVPESLLTLWDEEDLELLLCGIRQTTINSPHLRFNTAAPQSND